MSLAGRSFSLPEDKDRLVMGSHGAYPHPGTSAEDTYLSADASLVGFFFYGA